MTHNKADQQVEGSWSREEPPAPHRERVEEIALQAVTRARNLRMYRHDQRDTQARTIAAETADRILALPGVEEVEHRVCAGCGSSWHESNLRASGFRSCCPERKMLTAKEWANRAEAAERARDQAVSKLSDAEKALERIGRGDLSTATKSQIAREVLHQLKTGTP